VLLEDRNDGPQGPAEPGRTLESDASSPPSAAPGPAEPWNQAALPVQQQPAPRAEVPPEGSVIVDGITYRPAGFALRFWAFLIDMVILSLCHALLLALLGYEAPDGAEMLDLLNQLMAAMLTTGLPQGELLARVEELQRVTRIVGWLNVSVCLSYYTIFHTVAGATLGKLCLGLSVLSSRGHRIGFSTALLRYTVRLLLSRFFFGGVITVFFDQRRRSIYDMVAGTNVFRQVSSPPDSRIN